MKIRSYYQVSPILLLIGTKIVVEAWSSAPNKYSSRASTKSDTSAPTVTRKMFWTKAGISSLGALDFLCLPDASVAAPPKKIPSYLQERGSLESGLSPCPGQPAKKCCWSTEDKQGRRVQRWEAPANLQGNAKAIAQQLEEVMAEYPQEGQNDVDRGGWVKADKQTDSDGKGTYLRYEFTSGKFKYIDELELLVDASGKVSVRTSSRSAGFDYGVNASRLNYIQKQLQKRGWIVELV